MSKALSFDLRIRALAAVAGGMTHRAAGERFGVSAAVGAGITLPLVERDVPDGQAVALIRPEAVGLASDAAKVRPITVRWGAVWQFGNPWSAQACSGSTYRTCASSASAVTPAKRLVIPSKRMKSS